jgi:hypothetical protein
MLKALIFIRSSIFTYPKNEDEKMKQKAVWILQLIDAVVYLHSMRHIHRDIKPRYYIYKVLYPRYYISKVLYPRYYIQCIISNVLYPRYYISKVLYIQGIIYPRYYIYKVLYIQCIIYPMYYIQCIISNVVISSCIVVRYHSIVICHSI